MTIALTHDFVVGFLFGCFVVSVGLWIVLAVTDGHRGMEEKK